MSLSFTLSKTPSPKVIEKKHYIGHIKRLAEVQSLYRIGALSMLVSNSPGLRGFPATGKRQAKGGPVQWPFSPLPGEGPGFLVATVSGGTTVVGGLAQGGAIPGQIPAGSSAFPRGTFPTSPPALSLSWLSGSSLTFLSLLVLVLANPRRR